MAEPWNTFWTDAKLDEAQQLIAELGSVAAAAAALGKTSDALRRAFSSHDRERPSKHLPPDGLRNSAQHTVAQPAQQPQPTQLPRDVQRLVDAIRTGPREFSALCDRLDMAPSKCRRLVEEAEELGVQVHVEHDHVGLQWDDSPAEVRRVASVAPAIDAPIRVGVLSDAHFGSKFCMREQIKDFVHAAYEQGCREFVCPGDLLDGHYPDRPFEVTHSGLAAQTDDACEGLPILADLRYHWITGNHDFTFAARSGMSVGGYIENAFRERGRDDVRFYGDRGAYLDVGGVVFHLWHPIGSNRTYAISYPLQKQLEKYSAIKPHVLLAGHWHKMAYVNQRGVKALACPCFQGGQSAFGKSIGGNPVIGGLILTIRLTEHGTIREFGWQERTYYEHERIVSVRNPMHAIRVEPTVSRPVAVPDTRWQACS